MAISDITNPIGSTFSKLRRRSKPKSPAGPSRSIDGDEINSTPKSDSKKTQFQQVFAFLDTNADGKISADELRAYFDSVGDAASHEEVRKIIGELSGGGDSGDSLLEFEEFSRVMELGDGGEDEDALQRAFEMYEVEKGSGCITAEGLREVLRIGVDVKSVGGCEAMIGVYDLDGNGVLDYEEFCKMMMT